MSGISPRSGEAAVFPVRGCLYHPLSLQLLSPGKAALSALDSKNYPCIFPWNALILLTALTLLLDFNSASALLLPPCEWGQRDREGDWAPCPPCRQDWLLGQGEILFFLWQGTLLSCFPARIWSGSLSLTVFVWPHPRCSKILQWTLLNHWSNLPLNLVNSVASVAQGVHLPIHNNRGKPRNWGWPQKSPCYLEISVVWLWVIHLWGFTLAFQQLNSREMAFCCGFVFWVFWVCFLVF